MHTTQQFHCEEREVVIGKELTKTHQIWMFDARHRPKFTAEPRELVRLRVIENFCRDQLVALLIEDFVHSPEATSSEPTVYSKPCMFDKRACNVKLAPSAADRE